MSNLNNLSSEETKFLVIIVLFSGLIYFRTDSIAASIIICSICVGVFLTREKIVVYYPDLVFRIRSLLVRDGTPAVDEHTIVLGRYTQTKFGWVTINLRSLLHTMIVTASQFGKSTAVETFIYQVVMTQDPKKVKIAISDPIKNGFTVFEKVPHLFRPIARKGQTLNLLKEIEQEMNNRISLLKIIPQQFKCDDMDDFERACKMLGYDIERPPMLLVFLDEMHAVTDIAGVNKILNTLHKTAAGVDIKLISCSHRATVENFSKEAEGQITFKLIGHQSSNQNYALAGVVSDVRDRAIHEPGHFCAYIKGFWYYMMVEKIPVDILERNMQNISTQEPEEQLPEPVLTKIVLRGSTEDKRDQFYNWFEKSKFHRKPSVADVMNRFDVSEKTARTHLNKWWEKWKDAH